MANFGASEEVQEKIFQIVENISFKGAGNEKKLSFLEFKIFQDADQLDGLSTLKITRTFTYGRSKGKPIHDPNIKPDIEGYGKDGKQSETTINHFFEKILLLKDLMNTKKAKKKSQQNDINLWKSF